MKRLSAAAAALLLVLSLTSCNIVLNMGGGGGTVSNLATTAASVVSQAAYTAVVFSGQPRSLLSRTTSSAVPSLLGSQFALLISTSSVNDQKAYYLDQQLITQNGKSYYLTGTITYTVLKSNLSLAYVYAPNMTITGPDYSGNVTVDINETYASTLSGTITNMTCVAAGYVAGQTFSSTLTFYF